MNTPPLISNFMPLPDNYSAQSITDLSARAAQMYKAQVGLPSHENTTSEEIPPVTTPVKRPSKAPHGEEIFQALKKLKPERIETVLEDGSVRVTYNYHKPFYAFLSKFSGAGDGKPTYPLASDLMYVVAWCRHQLVLNPEPVVPPPGGGILVPTNFGFEFGLTQTLMSMMALDYSVREWMYALLTTADGPEDEQAFQL